MSDLPDFDRMVEANTCPPELELDLLHYGELAPELEAALRTHIDQCAACTGRMSLRAAGFDALDVDARVMKAAIRRGMEPKPSPLRRWFAGLSVLVAAAALFFLLDPTPPGPNALNGDGIRVKGGPVLKVHVQTPTDSRQLQADGAVLSPGASVRFVVDLETPAHIRIFGVEAKGKMYTAWPLVEGSMHRRPAGKDQVLDGAAVLDGTLGKEAFHLVACPSESAPLVCTVSNVDAKPVCPAGCQIASFHFEKK